MENEFDGPLRAAASKWTPFSVVLFDEVSFPLEIIIATGSEDNRSDMEMDAAPPIARAQLGLPCLSDTVTERDRIVIILPMTTALSI